MSVVLYSTDCPQCNVLKKKLENAGVEFELSNDVDSMIEKGFTSAPVLGVDDQYMTFREAIDWINSRQE